MILTFYLCFELKIKQFYAARLPSTDKDMNKDMKKTLNKIQ
jgi:hypothetical protein